MVLAGFMERFEGLGGLGGLVGKVVAGVDGERQVIRPEGGAGFASPRMESTSQGGMSRA